MVQQLGQAKLDYTPLPQPLRLPIPFGNLSTLPTACAPKDLRDESALVFLKGDANYRRLIGDRLWPTDTPFSDVAGYFPAKLCALRTLKAELG